ncbi:MAG: M20 family peptidase [Ottowia sp.]
MRAENAPLASWPAVAGCGGRIRGEEGGMMLKKGTAALLLVLLALLAVLYVGVWTRGSRQHAVPPLQPLAVNADAAAARLGQAVRLQTVSSAEDADLNADEFQRLHALLAQQFPQVHAQLEREAVNGLSLLYTWPGSDPDAAPILLLAHQDVVPVAPGTESDWEQPPYSGAVRDGYIWGRGAWDDKGNLLAQLEAVEMLLVAGWQPERSVYLAYGADEEVGGLRGAALVAELLGQRGVRPAFVIDEGLLVLQGVVPGVRSPTALVGVAEKGYASVRLVVRAQPGHSSMPPPVGSSAIALLSRALTQLEDHPMPARLDGVAGAMFETLAPEMQGLSRLVLSNLWLFGPLVKRQLEASPGTNAALRTTTALAVVQAGNKDNVLPGRAQAIINFRLAPDDSLDDVLEHVRTVVARVVPAEQFALEVLPGAREASAVARTDTPQFDVLSRTIREVFPDAVVAPGLMVAGTDSVHYGAISKHIYKFSPIRASSGDLARFHGTNERLSVAGYADAIRFYHRLIQQLSAAKMAP